MKNSFYIFLFIIVSNLSAQSYHQLLDTTTIWTVEYYDYISLPPIREQINYRYIGDIILDSFTYKDFGNGAILREDTIARKVYLRNESYINNECLLYNFAAEKGDTVDACNLQIFIDSVSTIVLNNSEVRKIFYYKGAIKGEYYIEGIGSNLGFIEISEANGPPALDLMCVKKGSVNIYGQRCNEVTSLSNINQNNGSVKIFPNPSNTCVNIEATVKIETYCIIDFSGKVVLKDRLYSNTIKLNNLQTGNYFIEFYDIDGYPINKQSLIIKN
jgi:hypothetical protein